MNKSSSLHIPDTVQDAAQNIFLRYLKSGTCFSSEEHEKSYFLRAACNECSNFRHSFWRTRRVDYDDIPEHISAVSPEEPQDASVLLLQELRPQSKRESVSCISLVDADGNSYPLLQQGSSTIFSITETPAAPIVGLQSNQLTYLCDFEEPAVLSVPVPEDGQSTVLETEFTFPDGITPGKLSAIGYNNTVRPEYNTILTDFYPLGYLSVVIEGTEINNTTIWHQPQYTSEYDAFADPVLADYFTQNPMNGREPGEYTSFYYNADAVPGTV